MSKNIKEIGKELLGKSLNSFHRKTGLTQLEKNNEIQDGILDGILSQVDDAYIEKTEQSNVIHLEGSGDGVVVLDSIEGNTLTDAIGSTTSYSLKNTTKSINSRWSTIGISCRQGKLNDKIYYRIKLKINNLTTDSSQLSIMSMRDSGGYNHNVALFKDLEIGNINEISTIRAIDSNCNNLYNSVTIGNHGEVPSDCTDGVEFANFTLIDFIVVNLTELFGSGNEPTKEWCDSNIPYFEGLQSSFEEKVNDQDKYEIEILIKNKNLFDGEMEDGAYSASGVELTHPTFRNKNKFILVESNTKYNLQCINSGEKPVIHEYDENKTFIRYGYDISRHGTHERTKYINFRTQTNTLDYKFQLEKGDVLSEYIPHKTNKIKLLLDEPLRSAYEKTDRLLIKDNKLVVERWLQENIVNGSENWSKSDGIINSNTTDYANFFSSNAITNHYNEQKCLSDKFMWEHSFNLKEHNWINNGGYNVCILKSKANTINEFKTWLSNNNIKVVSVLREPTYEEVLNEYGEPIILEGYENGTLYIVSTVLPTTAVRYTPKMESFKTLKEVNKNNNSIILDINENIIPYMMDVDYMIMEKELCLLNTKNIRKVEVLDMTSMQKRTQEMLERLIKGKTLTEQECKTRVTTYLNAGKITDEQAEELMLVISEIYN